MSKNESIEGMKEGVLYRFVTLIAPSVYKLSIFLIAVIAIIASEV